MASWASNSFRQSYPEDTFFRHRKTVYAILSISLIILVHSNLSHGVGRYAATLVRLHTEIAAFVSFLYALIIMVIAKKLSLSNNPGYSTFETFFCDGILILVVEMCNVFTFSRLLVTVSRVSSLKSLALMAYAVFVLAFPWFSAYIIAPAFVDTNTPSFSEIYRILFGISSWGLIIYYVYFIIEFGFIFWTIYTTVRVETRSVRQTKLLVIRGAAHCVTSCGAAMAWYYSSNRRVGNYYFILISLLSMHCWLNARRKIVCRREVFEFVGLLKRLNSQSGRDPSRSHSGHHLNVLQRPSSVMPFEDALPAAVGRLSRGSAPASLRAAGGTTATTKNASRMATVRQAGPGAVQQIGHGSGSAKAITRDSHGGLNDLEGEVAGSSGGSYPSRRLPDMVSPVPLSVPGIEVRSPVRSWATDNTATAAVILPAEPRRGSNQRLPVASRSQSQTKSMWTSGMNIVENFIESILDDPYSQEERKQNSRAAGGAIRSSWQSRQSRNSKHSRRQVPSQGPALGGGGGPAVGRLGLSQRIMSMHQEVKQILEVDEDDVVTPKAALLEQAIQQAEAQSDHLRNVAAGSGTGSRNGGGQNSNQRSSASSASGACRSSLNSVVASLTPTGTVKKVHRRGSKAAAAAAKKTRDDLDDAAVDDSSFEWLQRSPALQEYIKSPPVEKQRRRRQSEDSNSAAEELVSHVGRCDEDHDAAPNTDSGLPAPTQSYHQNPNPNQNQGTQQSSTGAASGADDAIQQGISIADEGRANGGSTTSSASAVGPVCMVVTPPGDPDADVDRKTAESSEQPMTTTTTVTTVDRMSIESKNSGVTVAINNSYNNNASHTITSPKGRGAAHQHAFAEPITVTQLAEMSRTGYQGLPSRNSAAGSPAGSVPGSRTISNTSSPMRMTRKAIVDHLEGSGSSEPVVNNNPNSGTASATLRPTTLASKISSKRVNSLPAEST